MNKEFKSIGFDIPKDTSCTCEKTALSKAHVDKFKLNDYYEYIKQNYLYKTDNLIGKELNLNPEMIKLLRFKFNLMKRRISSPIWKLTKEQKEFINNNYKKLGKKKTAEYLDIDEIIIKYYVARYMITTPLSKEFEHLGSDKLFFIYRASKTKTPKEIAYIMDLSENDILSYLNWIIKVKSKVEFTDDDINYIKNNYKLGIDYLSRHFSISNNVIKGILDDLKINYISMTRWTKEEVDLLIKECNKVDSIYKVNVDKFKNRTELSIYKKAYSLYKQGLIRDIFEKRRRIDEDIKDKIVDLYYSYMTIEDIAKELNMGKEQVHSVLRVLRNNGTIKKRVNRNSVSESDMHNVLELKNKGLKIKEIASQLNITESKVIATLASLKRNNIDFSKVKYNWTDEENEILVKMYNKGFSYQEIANRLNVEKSRVASRIYFLRGKGVLK